MPEPAQTTVVPPWSPLKDPLGQALPFYGSTRPFPPPIPLLGGYFTGRLRAAGNRPEYVRPRNVPFDAPATAIVDREAAVRRPANEMGEGLLANKSPSDLMRAYYKRPSWVWAVMGLFGAFVGGSFPSCLMLEIRNQTSDPIASLNSPGLSEVNFCRVRKDQRGAATARDSRARSIRCGRKGASKRRGRTGGADICEG